MNDEFFSHNSKSIIRPRVKVASPLVFNIPEAVLLRLNNITEEKVIDSESTLEVISPKIELHLEASEPVQELELVLELEEKPEVLLGETITSETVESALESEPVLELQLERSERSIVSEKMEDIATVEMKTKVVPFFELRLHNPEAVYKVGHAFLTDIEKGKKHFGFTTLSTTESESLLMVYASFIQHSLKKPVLVVTKNIASSDFDIHRKHFNEGMLLNWKTWEWGDLCFVDHSQLLKTEKDFAKTDLDFIHNHFSAILWSLPSGNTHGNFQQVFLSILAKLSSVTMVVEKGVTKSKTINKAADYYNCFNIPVKGVLFA